MGALPALEERYRLGPEIGRGGIGVVHRAEEIATGEAVAVKLPQGVPDTVERERILREAGLAEALDHPNLVRFLGVCDAGEGRLALAYELIEGEALDERLRDGEVPEREELLRLARGISAGLEAMHRAGLVYRDLKPANVMLRGDGTPVLVDFGLLKSEAGGDTVTRTGELMATPEYVAPELLVGARPGVASDLYALGCLLYRLTAGTPPFTGEPAEVARCHLDRDPPAIPDPPVADTRRLANFFSTALAKEPEGRFLSAAEVSAAFEQLVAGGAGAGPDTTHTQTMTRQVTAELTRGPTREAAPAPSPEPEPSPRRVWPGALLLLLALPVLGWWLYPTSTGSATVELVEGDVGPDPFGPGWAEDVRRELEERRPEPLADPHDWGLAVTRLESLGRLQKWISGGGAPEELPLGTLQAMRRLEVDFDARRMGTPLYPFVYLEPAEEGTEASPELREALRASGVPADFPERAGPWLRREGQELLALDRTIDQMQEELRAARGERDFPGGVDLGPTAALYGFETPTLETFLQHAGHSPGNRRKLRDWLWEPSRQLRAALWACVRSMEEEPESRELAAVWMVRTVRSARSLFSGSLMNAPLRLLLGRKPRHAPGQWLQAEILRAQIEVRFNVMGARGRRDDVLVGLFEAGCGSPRGPGLAAYRLGEAREGQIDALVRSGRVPEALALAPVLAAEQEFFGPGKYGRLMGRLEKARETRR